MCVAFVATFPDGRVFLQYITLGVYQPTVKRLKRVHAATNTEHIRVVKQEEVHGLEHLFFFLLLQSSLSANCSTDTSNKQSSSNILSINLFGIP